jgi:aromatic ring-opening dioxygenase LigB subunit
MSLIFCKLKKNHAQCFLFGYVLPLNFVTKQGICKTTQNIFLNKKTQNRHVSKKKKG